MKKTLLVILGIFIIILIFVVYLLYNYNITVKQAQNFNKKYEKYCEEEILGVDLVTLLNTVEDYNEKNNIDKDEKDRYYIETEESILVTIKFKEKKESVKMEDILLQGIENFNKYYATSTFKCTKIEYHEQNKQVRSLYFEQI